MLHRFFRPSDAAYLYPLYDGGLVDLSNETSKAAGGVGSNANASAFTMGPHNRSISAEMLVRSGQSRFAVDAFEKPDYTRFPALANAVMYEAELKPGDLIFGSLESRLCFCVLTLSCAHSACVHAAPSREHRGSCPHLASCAFLTHSLAGHAGGVDELRGRLELSHGARGDAGHDAHRFRREMARHQRCVLFLFCAASVRCRADHAGLRLLNPKMHMQPSELTWSRFKRYRRLTNDYLRDGYHRSAAV